MVVVMIWSYQSVSKMVPRCGCSEEPCFLPSPMLHLIVIFPDFASLSHYILVHMDSEKTLIFIFVSLCKLSFLWVFVYFSPLFLILIFICFLPACLLTFLISFLWHPYCSRKFFLHKPSIRIRILVPQSLWMLKLWVHFAYLLKNGPCLP